MKLNNFLNNYLFLNDYIENLPKFALLRKNEFVLYKN